VGVGVFVGVLDGVFIGVADGVIDGVIVGVSEGVTVGDSDGVIVGVSDGVIVGDSDGVIVGDPVGVSVGDSVVKLNVRVQAGSDALGVTCGTVGATGVLVVNLPLVTSATTPMISVTTVNNSAYQFFLKNFIF
jgi:hypothetical protein